MTLLISYFLRFVLILPAIILHEVAHGFAARALGDPTAQRAGRLTLNPIPHIDLWGTLLLPALLILGRSPVVFGYAKPVPFDPRYFKDQKTGMLLTGIAGPLTNLALAVVFGVALRFVPTPETVSLGATDSLYSIVLTFVFLNLALAFFNLIPIPPLDGSRVVQRFLSGSALRFYYQMERYGFVILFAVLFLLPGAIDAYLGVTVFPLLKLITGL
ncbi:MAG TPA: site-2 protease family protein [Coriobacteriia bacterium]|jgi:Zn-dependent protease